MSARPHKIPGPDHPIEIERNPKRVVVKVAGRTVADTRDALALREASYPPVNYIPREDVDMSLFRKTASQTWCPYKGEASYYAATIDGRAVADIAWSYETPFEPVGEIEGRLAFYPDRVDAIDEID